MSNPGYSTPALLSLSEAQRVFNSLMSIEVERAAQGKPMRIQALLDYWQLRIMQRMSNE